MLKPFTQQLKATLDVEACGIQLSPFPTSLLQSSSRNRGGLLAGKRVSALCALGAPSDVTFLLQCDVGTENWQRVNTELPVKSPRFALFDLVEGKSYRFRVRCSNSAGVGEPSEATEVTVVGDKLGKSRVRLSTCDFALCQEKIPNQE